MVSSLMNAFEGECLLRNLYKCKQVVYIIVVCGHLVYVCLYRFVAAALLLYLLFKLMLLLYFCVFVDHVNKPIIFVFVGFVYNFMNTIFISLTILLRKSRYR